MSYQEDKNSSAIVFHHGRLIFNFFKGLLCFVHIQFKNEVASLEVGILSKIDKDGGR